MRRRDFIKGIAGSATAWPLVARATDRLPRIGVLMGYPEGDLEAQSYIAAFREGLRTLGWTKGRDPGHILATRRRGDRMKPRSR